MSKFWSAVTWRIVIGEQYFASDHRPSLTAQERLLTADGNMSVGRVNSVGGDENPLTGQEKRGIVEQICPMVSLFRSRESACGRIVKFVMSTPHGLVRRLDGRASRMNPAWPSANPPTQETK